MGARLLDFAGRAGSGVMLVSLYLFLYTPIVYIIFTSFSKNIAWPFPPEFSLRGYQLLYVGRTYHEALYNSLILGIGSALLCTLFATLGSIAVLKYRSRWRRLIVVTYLSPLFIATLLVGISSLLFNRQVLGLPGNMGSAIVANAVHGTSFAFLIMLAQMLRYDWRLDDAAMVFCDPGLEYRSAVVERGDCRLFVRSHQSAVTDHIGAQDRCELALDFGHRYWRSTGMMLRLVCDGPFQLQVLGLANGTHPTFTKPAGGAVVGDDLTDHVGPILSLRGLLLVTTVVSMGRRNTLPGGKGEV